MKNPELIKKLFSLSGIVAEEGELLELAEDLEEMMHLMDQVKNVPAEILPDRQPAVTFSDLRQDIVNPGNTFPRKFFVANMLEKEQKS